MRGNTCLVSLKENIYHEKKNLLWDMSVNLSDQAHKWYKMQEFLSCEKDCSVAKYIKSE